MIVIAHRGASMYAPENTMAAFKLAYEMGAEALELDVQMTKDQELVILHDDTLERTTNGSDLVMESTYETIRSLDAGSWFDPQFVGEQVPSLREVLEWLPSTITLHVELKKAKQDKRDLHWAVLDLIRSFGKLDQTILSSFDHKMLKELMAVEDLRLGVLVDRRMNHPLSYLVRKGLLAHSYHPNVKHVTKALVEVLHGQGLKVYVYTVNDPDLADELAILGVDGLFSDNLLVRNEG